MLSYKKERLPNDLTHMRWALIPVFLLLMWLGSTESKWMPVAIAIWWIAYVTDIIDGYLARRWKCTSAYGALMDPLADKLIVLCALAIGLHAGWFPLWLFIVLEGREALATAFRMTALERSGVVIPSGWKGKRKADSQMCGLTLMLAAQAVSNAMSHVLTVGGILLIVWCLTSKNWAVLWFAIAFLALTFFPNVWHQAGLAFLIGSAVLSVWSLFEYFVRLKAILAPPAKT